MRRGYSEVCSSLCSVLIVVWCIFDQCAVDVYQTVAAVDLYIVPVHCLQFTAAPSKSPWYQCVSKPKKIGCFINLFYRLDL